MNEFGVSRGPQVKVRHQFCHLFIAAAVFLTSDVFVLALQGPPGLPGLKGPKVRFTTVGVMEEITINMDIFPWASLAIVK